jgi:transcriptional regulator with XRE-family HTH domain
MSNQAIDRALKIAKEKRGWNQPEFAEAMGVDKQHVTNWKRRGMPASRYEKAARILDITVDELLGGPANAVRSTSRVSDDIGTYGHGVTKEGMAFAREWQKLREPLKTQVHTMVETLVAEQVRADSKAGKGPKGPKSAPTRPNA